jgi:hypothetical protein
MRPGNPVITSLRLPVDQDPAGWVWLNQRPLVISPVQSETRWPEASRRARDLNITTTVLVPLTAGVNRLGAFGFSSVAPARSQPGRARIPGARCQRVRRRGRVLPRQAGGSPGAGPAANAVRHHECACVEAVDRDELFSAISAQLSKVIRHDFSVLTLRNETGGLEMVGLHFTGARSFSTRSRAVHPEGMPAAEVLATASPWSCCDVDMDRYPSPEFSPVRGTWAANPFARFR